MDANPYSLDSLRKGLDVLRRHWMKAAAFFVLTLVGVGLALAFCPRTYVSEAKLFVRVGRESITLDPTATTGQTISVYESRESELNSVLDVIDSRVILEQAVETLGVGAVLYGRPLSEPPTAPASPLEREKAIQRLRSAVKVSHGKKSSVVTVSARAGSPELAQRIVQAVLDAFQQQHLRVNRTAGSYEFFTNQEALLKTQFEQATAALRDAKNEAGLASIEGQRKIVEDRISAVEAQVLEAEAALSASQATVASLRRALETLPERIVAQETVGFPNDAVDHTRQQLYTLQIRERELLAKYTEHHPQVMAVRRQIEQALRILDGQGAPTQEMQSLNPNRQQLELTLTAEESNAAALAARVESLREQSARMQQRLRTLNDNEGRITSLEQRAELLQASHRAYAEKLEQARIDQALGEDRISNVNLVQPATFVPKPVSPKKALVLLLGLVVAGIGSIGVAFGCDLLERLRGASTTETQRHGESRQCSKPLGFLASPGFSN